MKKLCRLLIVSVLACGIVFAVAGCGRQDEQDPTPIDPDEDVVTTINDAYDGENRPNFDDIFDYDSGYEAQPPATEFTVTIAGTDKVTFDDGTYSRLFDAGEVISSDMFDISEEVASVGREFLGFGVLGADGNISGSVDLTGGNTVTFREDVTLVPYFTASGEFTQLTMSRFNTASLVGEFVSHYNAGTATKASGQVVRGEEYAVTGGLMLTDAEPIYAGSSLRFDTSYLGGDSVPAGVYEFEYNIDNGGDSDLHLSIYQVSMGTDYTAGDYLYERKHYRIDVNVAAGESTTVHGQYQLDSNANALTYVVFENDTDTLSLGISVAYRAVEGAEAPENPEPPETDLESSITLDESSFKNGFDVNGFTATSQRIGHMLTVPTEEQITLSDDPETVFEYWMLKREDSDEAVRVTSSTRVPACDAVLVPYFTPVSEITLDLPEGITYTGDLFDNTQLAGNVLVAPDITEMSGTVSGRSVAGWYLPDEDNRMVTEDTVVTEGGMRLAPYFAAAEGFTQLTVGSGRNTSYNPDAVPGDFTDHVAETGDGTATVTRNYAVIGNDGFAVGGGLLVNDPGVITAGSAIRLDTDYGDSNISAGVYEFEYNITNLGSEPFRFSLYQISASSEYKLNAETGSYYDYEARHRIDVELGAGESGTYSAKYNLGENGNALTYIVIEEDVSSLRFAISMAYASSSESADPANPLTDHNADIKISDNLPDGFEVTGDYSVSQRIGHRITLPTDDQIVNPDGLVIGEWTFTPAGGNYSVTVTDDTRVPEGGGTIAPVFVELTEITFDLPEGAQLTDDFSVRQPVGWDIVLPTDEQVTGDSGTIVGWYNTATNQAISSDQKVMAGLTIAPYYAAGGSGAVLTPCVGADNATVPDYVVQYNEDLTEYTDWVETDENGDPVLDGDGNPVEIDTDTVFSASQTYDNHMYGTRVTSDFDFAANDGFRVKTAASERLVANNSYKINITLTNMAESGTLSFDMWQINSSSWMTEPNLSSSGSRLNSGETVEIGAGETVELTVTVTGYANSNLLTMFVFTGASEGLDLFISMSQATV